MQGPVYDKHSTTIFFFSHKRQKNITAAQSVVLLVELKSEHLGNRFLGGCFPSWVAFPLSYKIRLRLGYKMTLKYCSLLSILIYSDLGPFESNPRVCFPPLCGSLVRWEHSNQTHVWTKTANLTAMISVCFDVPFNFGKQAIWLESDTLCILCFKQCFV